MSSQKKAYNTYLDNCVEFQKRVGKDTYQRAFLRGCVKGLDDKLTAEEKKDKEQDETYGAKVTALVVKNGAEIDNFINTTWGELKTSRSNSPIRQANAFYAGVKEGRNTQIYKPISDNTRKQSDGVGLLNA